MQDLLELKNNIKKWSIELGFDDIGISGIDIVDDEKHLNEWLDKKYHGSMNYMMKHGKKRSRAELLVPGTIRVISLKIHYYSRDKSAAEKLKDDIVARANQEAEDQLEKAKSQISVEKDKVLLEIRKEVVDLSIDVAEKIIKKNISKDDNSSIIEESMQKLKNYEA